MLSLKIKGVNIMPLILLYFVICALISYLLGSLSFSIIISTVFYKKDIRTFGSGNAGMTNILRTFGKKAAVATFAGDIGKGILAVTISKFIIDNFAQMHPVYGAYLGAFCAILGHVYPVFFGFKGGKAVSVSTGTIIAIEPMLILPLAIVFFVAFLPSKMVSLGSIACAAAYPVCTFAYFFYKGENYIFSTACSLVIAAFVIYLHRKNIKRIMDKTEYKFMQKK